MPGSEGAQLFDVNKDNFANAAAWEAEVLAEFEDPNVTNSDFAPVRVEDVDSPLDGPRLGISGLNTIYTYNFDKVAHR